MTSAVENDLAFSRQMAELNAMLAAVTATCRAAEAEAISLRDQLAAAEARANENWRLYLASQDEWATERTAREEAVIQLGIERSTSERRKVRMAQVVAAEQRAKAAEAKCAELEYWRKEHASADFAWKIDFERAEDAEARVKELEGERKGILAESNMHASWKDRPIDEVLSALEFQGCMTNVLQKEIDELRALTDEEGK